MTTVFNGVFVGKFSMYDRVVDLGIVNMRVAFELRSIEIHPVIITPVPILYAFSWIHYPWFLSTVCRSCICVGFIGWRQGHCLVVLWWRVLPGFKTVWQDWRSKLHTDNVDGKSLSAIVTSGWVESSVHVQLKVPSWCTGARLEIWSPGWRLGNAP